MEVASKVSSGIEVLIRDALRVCAGDPGFGYFLLRTAMWQKAAASRRVQWDKKGLHVPAFLISSITRQCNLKCKGCYAKKEFADIVGELPVERWLEIWQEARDLGISFVLVAGGEPFVRPEIIDAIDQVQEIIFPVFTNGLLLDEALIERLRNVRNLIPVVSLEGHQHETDDRRGEGVYDQLKTTIGRLAGSGLFSGVSITVTSQNVDMVLSNRFVESAIADGGKLFFFVEYVPVQEGTEHLVLSPEQRRALRSHMAYLRSKFRALFIAFPGDEEEMGGCLAAGRGFVHINPAGALEPCPFAPYSDADVREASLRQALKSRFLQAVRDNHSVLNEGASGCALWENRETVRHLLDGKQET